MRKLFNGVITAVLIVGCTVQGTEKSAITSEYNARSNDFNFGWKFLLAEDSASIDESAPGFQDSEWRDVRLPHDWSVEHPFDSINGEGATGYLPGGTGWYRKHFDLKPEQNKTTYIVFDGVYNNSEVWVNGQKLGFHPYGYSPFYYDISHALNGDGKGNVVAVKVDRTRYVDSRWYSGSGIYRNVELISTDRLHIPVWGTFITTPEVSSESALARMDVQVKNDYTNDKSVEINTDILDANGKKVTSSRSYVNVRAEQTASVLQEFNIPTPSFWDLDAPSLYKAVTTISSNGKQTDQYETVFGIRSIRFDTDGGFFLNGKNIKIKGVCLHHDGGLVGAAVPKGVWRRRLQKLKDGGCNAIRISHNPASQEFLDLCDEMGFLVQDEFYDEWDYPKDKRLNQQERHVDYHSRGHAGHFQEWAEKDLKTVVQAHRNHPSIFQWSIGNEIEWTYHPRYRNVTGYFNMNWKGNYFWEQPPISPEEIKQRYKDIPGREYILSETAQKLSRWTKEMDTTRYVTANCILPSASHLSGYTDALDVVGYSYRRVLYDYGHEHYPEKPIMGTENLGQWHEWKAVAERDHISGLFIWTGVDYMGESHNAWPRKATPSGLLDVGGFEKGSYHMYKTLWDDAPHIHIATQTLEKSINKIDEASGLLVANDPDAWKTRTWFWQDVNNHWNYDAKETMSVEIYSNCEEVELFLNEKSLGSRRLSEFEDHIYKWAVPFEEGTLEARGKKDQEMVTSKLVTAGQPAAISIVTDKSVLNPDGYDVAHIIVQLVDAESNPVKSEDRQISFMVNGDARILGVDNGAPDNVQHYQAKSIVTSQGRAMMLIQSNQNPSDLTITARSKGLGSASVNLTIK
ncbi:MAG: glycoside hydrolase family 2 TIM barrel-domain containing protein [Cyclobacteriaceae bacterium]